MLDQTTEERFREYLGTLPLTTLRIVGRRYGVAQSTATNKQQLISEIVDLLMGRTSPVVRSGRGAPVKQNYLDPEIVNRLERLRNEVALEAHARNAVVSVASGMEEEISPYEKPVYTGILEITKGGYGFVRAKNCQPTAGKDVFVPAASIHSLRLRRGDFVACTVTPREQNDAPAMGELYSVNELPVGHYEERPLFDNLTAQYPKDRIDLSADTDELSMRTLDLFAPIGKGQRALIIAPPKAGKTTLLKSIARAIARKGRALDLIVLLIDERPEEVTDFRMSVERAQIISSTFDEGAEHHIRAAELTIEHAKRLAEHGRDVVILLDSLTKLTRAYNYVAESTGKTLSGGMEAGAFAEPKRFFGTARNTFEAGSITILATALIETGSRMDDVIYEEFKGTGNSDIFLSRELAERRIFPAIDIRRSGTRKEELLLSEEELGAVFRLRERGIVSNTSGLYDMMRRTKSNAEFVARLPEWLRVYKNG